LSQSAYSIILLILNEIGENHWDGEIPKVLKAVLTSAPSVGDKVISPAWLQLVGSAMVALKASDPHGCADELAQVWKTVWAFLESTNGPTRIAAAQALDQLTQCITPELIAVAVKEAGSPSPSSTLCAVIAQSTTALGSLAYAPSMAEVLAAISSLIICLRYRKAPSAPTAAELLILPTIQRIAALRIEKRFEFKEAADLALSAAFRVMGPEVVLRILPLNLEPEDRYILCEQILASPLMPFK
jgi:ribosomal RNA-processing protein 12